MRILYIAISSIVLLTVIIVCTRDNPSNKEVITCAKYEVSYSNGNYTISNADIVAKDGHNRYIVTITKTVFTVGNQYNQYYVVYLEFDKTGDKYWSAVLDPGNGRSIDDCVEIFKTESKYHWGENFTDYYK